MQPHSANSIPLTIAARTDTGRARKHNEDFIGHYTDPAKIATHGTLMVVCDGVGGAAAGEIASKTAVETIINTYFSLPARMTVQERLVQAIQRANEVIFELNQHRDREMASTVVAAVIIDAHLVVAHAGDSRAYLIRQGKIVQLTQDHSWVDELVRSGDLSPEEARRHPWRNRITRGLGMNPQLQVDVGVFDWREGDILVLCSDGLTRHVADQEILAVAAQLPPDAAAERLIRMANQRGGKDNISVIIARATPEGAAISAAGMLPPALAAEPTHIPASASPDALRRYKYALAALLATTLLILLIGGGWLVTSLIRSQEAITFVPTLTPASMVAQAGSSPSPTSSPTSTSTPTLTPTTTPTPTQTPIPTSTPLPIPTTPIPQPQGTAIVIAQGGANLRDKDKQLLTTLPLGHPVQILESCKFTDQDWCKVKAIVEGEEKEGWMRGDLLVWPHFQKVAGSQGASIQLSLPQGVTGRDVRILAGDQLLLATTHDFYQTPLLFQIPIIDVIKLDIGASPDISGDRVIPLGYGDNNSANASEPTIRQAALAPKPQKPNESQFGLLAEGDMSVSVWDVNNPSSRKEKCTTAQPIATFAFGPGGGRIACSIQSGDIILEQWEGTKQWKTRDTSDLLTNLAVAFRQEYPQKRFSVVAGLSSNGNTYYVYRSQEGNRLAFLNQPIQVNQINNVGRFSIISLSPDAHWLALGAIGKENNNPMILAAEWEGEEESLSGFQTPTLVPTNNFLQGEITALNFSPGGKMLAAGDDQGNVVVIRMKDYKVIKSTSMVGQVRALAFSPDNQYLTVLTSSSLHLIPIQPHSESQSQS